MVGFQRIPGGGLTGLVAEIAAGLAIAGTSELVKGTKTIFGRMVAFFDSPKQAEKRAEKRQADWANFKEKILPQEYSPKIARMAIAAYEAENGSLRLADRKVSLSKEKGNVKYYAAEIRCRIGDIEDRLTGRWTEKEARLKPGPRAKAVAERIYELRAENKMRMRFEAAYRQAFRECKNIPEEL